MRSALIASRLLLALAPLAACGSSPAPGRTQCASMHVDAMGGTVTSPSGASVMIPPRALMSGTDVSVCVLTLGSVPGQHSPMIEFAPTTISLAVSAEFTMPVDTTTPPATFAELRLTPTSPSAENFGTTTASPGFVVFSAPRLGDVRIMEALDLDGAIDDAGGGAADVNRPDAPRPVGPVVVGPDLTPADYACLAMHATPPSGAPITTTLRAVDWSDRSIRSGYALQLFPAPTWVFPGDCTTTPGCTAGTTDATGEVTVTIPSGPLWVSPTTPTPIDSRHAATTQWVANLSVPTTASVVEVPVLSQATQSAITSSIGFGGSMVLGFARDCAAHPVQRVRVRIFDETSHVEVLNSPLGTAPVLYGNGVGFPTSTADRTVIDGLYLALPNGNQVFRVEAWGILALGGADVLLGCEEVDLSSGAPVLVDLGPLRSDAPSSCGSNP